MSASVPLPNVRLRRRVLLRLGPAVLVATAELEDYLERVEVVS